MRVRFLQSLAGLNFSYVPGAEYDIEPSMAIRYINTGLAERVAPDKTGSDDPRWEFRISPRTYLDRHGANAPNSELARQVLEKYPDR